jgi:hypothetical protein
MRMARSILTAVLIVTGIACAAGASPRWIWQVERDDVSSVIARAVNSKIETRDVEMPGEPQALVPHPELQIEGWRQARPPAKIEFRLRCSKRSQCGAFLARVNLSPAQRREFASAKPSPPNGRARSAVLALARQGRPARMAWQGNGIRLSIPVMCLQTGGLGDRIRVRDRNGRSFFVARVIGPAELEAVFE